MEWTSGRIRLLREVGLCLSQDALAKALGFAKRTVGNAERGVHPPSLALLRALDHVLENASDVQRDRFLTAMGAEQITTGPSLASARSRTGHCQAATRAASARELLTVLLARERKVATPGLRGLASRAGLLQ